MKGRRQRSGQGGAQGERARSQPLKGRRFTAEQRQHALLLAGSGMKRAEVAKVIGTTMESVRRWWKEAATSGSLPRPPQAPGAGPPSQEVASQEVPSDGAREAAATAAPQDDRSRFAPKDPGQGLGVAETEAIVSLKRRHPSMGPAQIRAQLKRFKGWRLAVRAIDRVLRDAGFEPVHRGSRPKGPEPVRFEAPRPNALWQADFVVLRLDGEKHHLLLVLDDCSRFVVGHGLGESPSAKLTTRVLDDAMVRHGKPEALRTDRGGAFLSKEMDRYLEGHLIDHVVGRPYRPQGGGKVEALVKTVRRELWDVEHFADREEATRRLAAFLDDYNHRRAHMGLDGLTPADRYFGRADEVLAAVNDASRQRHGALDRHAQDGAPIEETLAGGRAHPLEILRLVVAGGALEVRFCGHRVVVGRLEA